MTSWCICTLRPAALKRRAQNSTDFKKRRTCCKSFFFKKQWNIFSKIFFSSFLDLLSFKRVVTAPWRWKTWRRRCVRLACSQHSEVRWWCSRPFCRCDTADVYCRRFGEANFTTLEQIYEDMTSFLLNGTVYLNTLRDLRCFAQCLASKCECFMSLIESSSITCQEGCLSNLENLTHIAMHIAKHIQVIFKSSHSQLVMDSFWSFADNFPRWSVAMLFWNPWPSEACWYPARWNRMPWQADQCWSWTYHSPKRSWEHGRTEWTWMESEKNMTRKWQDKNMTRTWMVELLIQWMNHAQFSTEQRDSKGVTSLFSAGSMEVLVLDWPFHWVWQIALLESVGGCRIFCQSWPMAKFPWLLLGEVPGRHRESVSVLGKKTCGFGMMNSLALEFEAFLSSRIQRHNVTLWWSIETQNLPPRLTRWTSCSTNPFAVGSQMWRNRPSWQVQSLMEPQVLQSTSSLSHESFCRPTLGVGACRATKCREEQP